MNPPKRSRAGEPFASVGLARWWLASGLSQFDDMRQGAAAYGGRFGVELETAERLFYRILAEDVLSVGPEIADQLETWAADPSWAPDLQPA